jgi:nucleotidyltransferase substrate binding protein (TIGR01987 family)
MNQRLKDSLENLGRANTSLHAALSATPRNALVVSGIIKNFEFNYELSWKAMARLLAVHGVATSTPRQAIAEGFRKGFINDESLWLSMIADRNLTVHTYDEVFALEMTKRIEEGYLDAFDDFLERLRNEVAAS